MTPLEVALLDLVLRLGEAVSSASDEFEDLKNTPPPMPDDLGVRLTERLTLLATLKRVSTEGGAKRLAEARTPEEVRTFITAVYREERTRAPHDDYDLPGWPVLVEVERNLDAAAEEMRRAVWILPELWVAVRSTQYGLPATV